MSNFEVLYVNGKKKTCIKATPMYIRNIYMSINDCFNNFRRYSKLGSCSVVDSPLCSTKCVSPETDWISRQGLSKKYLYQLFNLLLWMHYNLRWRNPVKCNIVQSFFSTLCNQFIRNRTTFLKETEYGGTNRAPSSRN